MRRFSLLVTVAVAIAAVCSPSGAMAHVQRMSAGPGNAAVSEPAAAAAAGDEGKGKVNPVEIIDAMASSSGAVVDGDEKKEWKDVTDPEIIAKYEARVGADQGGVVQEDFQCGGVAVEKRTMRAGVLALAAQHGDADCFQVLIERGWQLGWGQTDFSPLMTTARKGHLVAMKLILAR
jgi:hypothetical protein